VNPSHLWIGTNDENVADKVKKGRQSRGAAHGAAVIASNPSHAVGEEHHLAKLTSRDVEEIRRLYGIGNRQVDIAETFNIAQSHISRIVRNENWT
jgi:hypothetical protein